ncbi:hypothetical protein ACIOG9_42510, partial [Streptomyces sp. NPDC088178]
AAISLFFAPPSKRPTASSRTRSLAALFLDCSDGVRSVRIDDGLTNVAARLPSISDSPAAQEHGKHIIART